MTALITASTIRTCLGTGPETFAALLRGNSGYRPLQPVDRRRLNVGGSYPIDDGGSEALFRASSWLRACIAEALVQSRLGARAGRVIAIIGTGLRELRSVERFALEGAEVPLDRLHFARAVREAAPCVAETITLSNACSAGGHALALAEDLLEQGEADAVIVAAADAMTESMIAMIGRFGIEPNEQVRPFDNRRSGVLLGDGAAALVVEPETVSRAALGRLLATGLSCDAFHETAPNADGVRRAVSDALERARKVPADIDLVIAHGTGTSLNDPMEAQLLRSVFASDGPGPWITAVKGGVGHTSGAAALVNVDVALRCFDANVVPPIVGLDEPLVDGAGLRFVSSEPVHEQLDLAIVNAFGFGGVNAVSLVEKTAGGAES